MNQPHKKDRYMDQHLKRQIAIDRFKAACNQKNIKELQHIIDDPHNNFLLTDEINIVLNSICKTKQLEIIALFQNKIGKFNRCLPINSYTEGSPDLFKKYMQRYKPVEDVSDVLYRACLKKDVETIKFICESKFLTNDIFELHRAFNSVMYLMDDKEIEITLMLINENKAVIDKNEYEYLIRELLKRGYDVKDKHIKQVTVKNGIVVRDQ